MHRNNRKALHFVQNTKENHIIICFKYRFKTAFLLFFKLFIRVEGIEYPVTGTKVIDIFILVKGIVALK